MDLYTFFLVNSLWGASSPNVLIFVAFLGASGVITVFGAPPYGLRLVAASVRPGGAPGAPGPCSTPGTRDLPLSWCV